MEEDKFFHIPKTTQWDCYAIAYPENVSVKKRNLRFPMQTKFCTCPNSVGTGFSVIKYPLAYNYCLFLAAYTVPQHYWSVLCYCTDGGKWSNNEGIKLGG